MPVPPQGLMTFPGIAQIERGSFTLLQGITPSIATLEIEPQDPSTIPLNGDLTITFLPLLKTPIVLYNCRIDKASFRYDQSGMVWSLSIMDRRWAWRFAGDGTPDYAGGPVSGWFNQRFNSVQPAPMPDDSMGTYQLGSINPDTIRTPRWLADQLLQAMGEQGYDISVLSDDINSGPLPEVLWDYDLPAPALQELCDRLGCRVVINPLLPGNPVRIVQLGIGLELPPDYIERISNVVDPPEIPESIMVVGNRTRYQVDLLLIPVGLDVDGTIKPIWELSYAPLDLLVQYAGVDRPDNETLGGWGYTNIDPQVGFGDIAGWETIDINLNGLVFDTLPQNIQAAFQIGALAPQVNPRWLARQTVFRWYRIAIDEGASYYDPTLGEVQTPIEALFPQPIPGWFKPGTKDQLYLEALWQILPLDEIQTIGWYDNEKRWRPYDAVVYGTHNSMFWQSLDSDVAQPAWDKFFNFTLPMPVGCNYSIDRERGIVMFDEPVYTYYDPGLPQQPQYLAPNIYLRTTVRPRYFDPNAQTQTQATDRYFRIRDLTNIGGTPGTGPRVIKRDELVKCVVPVLDKKEGIVRTVDNAQMLDREADYIIDAALLEYQTPTPQDATYMGIIPIGCDGAITSVSWNVGPEGATTRVARNTEIHYAIPTYRERVLVGSLARTTETTRQLQNQQRKQ